MASKVGLTARSVTGAASQLVQNVAAPAIPHPKVEFVPINSVNYWPDNPWKHDDVVPKLAELLAINGQVSSVIVWPKNMVIYKGNHTKKALVYLKQNLNKIAESIGEPVFAILSRINPDYIKVEYRDFPSETAANAYGISDNNAGKGGEYDDALLRKLLTSDKDYFNTKRTGFTEKELKQFTLSAAENMERLAKIDLQGDVGELGEFLILTFSAPEVLRKFKEGFSMGDHERKMDFSRLIGAFNPEWVEFMKPEIDIPF